GIGSANVVLRAEGLELDGVGAGLGRLAHQLLSDLEVALMIVADLGDDQDPGVGVEGAYLHGPSGGRDMPMHNILASSDQEAHPLVEPQRRRVRSLRPNL